MAISMHTIKPAKGSKKNRKRVGRGDASCGTYSGRGLKGQRSRSGGKSGLKRKGMRRILLSIPKKKGFTSMYDKYSIVSVAEIGASYKNGETVSPKNLKEKGLVDRIGRGVKVLANGEIKVKVKVNGCLYSESAKVKIEKAGGSIS